MRITLLVSLVVVLFISAPLSVEAALTVSCTPSAVLVQTEDEINWTASVSGGSGTISYAWMASQEQTTPVTTTIASYIRSFNKASGFRKVPATAINYPRPTTMSLTVTRGAETKTVECTPVTICAGPDETVFFGSTGAYPPSVRATDDIRCCNEGAETGGAYRNDIVCRGGGNLPNNKPDLYAGVVTPTSAVAGTAKTFNATITNQGDAVAGASSALLQKASTSSGTGAIDVDTDATPSLGINGADTASFSYTFPAADAGTTKYLRACADKSSASDVNGAVFEGSTQEGNNCGAWTPITVSVAPRPDLTIGSITPTTATEDTPVTFSATVTNSGTATTATGFTNVFQIDADSNHTAWTASPTDTSPVRTAGQTDVTSVSYTFPSPGTWYIRACADNNAAMVGTVTESNETNNCGSSWTAVAVSAAPQPNLSGGTTAVAPYPLDSNDTFTLSSTITNSGPGAATNFPNLFQIANEAVTSTVRLVSAQTLTLTASGGGNASDPISASTAALPAGNYNVRSCADSATGPGVGGNQSESNEGDNCGAWRAITVTAAVVTPPSVRCDVDATNVTVGGQTTYRATSAGGAPTSYTWTQSSQTGCTGTANRTCTFPVAGDYSMSVQAGSYTDTCNLVTAENAGCGSSPSLTLTSSTDRVKRNDGIFTIDWVIEDTDATSCSLRGVAETGEIVYSQNITINSCGAQGGTSAQSIATRTLYTLTCGSESVQADVKTDLDDTEF